MRTIMIIRKKTRPAKRKEGGSQLLNEKPKREARVKKGLNKTKKSEDIQELARTWDEDLCE